MSLVDDDARARIRESLDATLFVEAGAGTGKTSALVGRVVELVLAGRPMTSIAAITFTEAAAAELRERIRLALEAVVAHGTRDGRPGGVTLEDEGRSLAHSALEAVDESAFSTLHGFAQRILAAHAIEAGLPPGFTLRDAPSMEQAFGDAWAAFLAELLNDVDLRPVLHTALSLGLSPNELAVVARAFHDSWDLLVGRPTLANLSPTCDLAALVEPLERAVDATASCKAPEDGLLAHLQWIADLLPILRAADGDVGAIPRALTTKALTAGNRGKADAWFGRKPEIVALLKDAEAQRLAIRAEHAQALLHRILGRVRGFVLDQADLRRAEGVLEFHDLLVRARDLLDASATVRRSLRARFAHILIDEFQDTDPLQIELATRIGAMGDAPHWSGLDVEPGRLFFVGDPKQSIYRFRRADLKLYGEVRTIHEAGLSQLRMNWRSTSDVLDFVNATFSHWFRAGIGGGIGQAPWADLEVGRLPGPARSSTVAVLGGELAGGADVVRGVCAGDVAEVARLVRAQQWQVSEHDVNGDLVWRDARLDDIAVLIPTRTVLPALEGALGDANIPYRVESRSLVWSTQEIRDVLAVLRAVEDPGDSIATVAALTSPAFGCGDDDLAIWARAQGTFSWNAEAPPALAADHPVGAALRWMAALAAERSRLLVAEAVRRVIADRGLVEVATALPRQREAWARLRFVQEQALAFERSGAGGLRAFLDWADRQADEDAEALESVVPDRDDEAVRIATIHAAKGLEYPIVVIAGLGTKRNVEATQVLWRTDGHPEVACGAIARGWRTSEFAAARDEDDEKARLEQARLMYVACTRARDHLIVCVHRKPNTTSEVEVGVTTNAADMARFAAFASPDVTDIDALRSRFVEVPLAPAPPPVDPGRADAIAGQLAQERRCRDEVIEAASRPRIVSPSGLAAMEDLAAVPGLPLGLGVGGVGPDAEELGAVLEDGGRADEVDGVMGGADAALWSATHAAPVLARPGAGTAFGLAVHSLAEVAPLPHGGAWAWADLGERAVAAAASQGLEPGVAAGIAESVRAAMASRAAVEAGAATGVWRELSVAAEVEGIVIEGIIDLCFRREGGRARGLVVVDWKSDAIGADGIRGKVSHYLTQLAAYALALEAATGELVVQCSLVFCGVGLAARQHDISGSALAAAKGATRDRLARLRAG